MKRELNKYQVWYDQLIERARNRVITGYYEKHHIVPKSLGGANDESNLVKLTAREHVMAHMLLPRFVEEPSKMWYALWCMVNTNGVKVNSRLHEQARVEGHQKLVASTEWLESVNKAATKRKHNQTWRKNKILANQKLAQDPEWRRINKEKNQKQAQDPVYRAKLKAAWVCRKEKQNQDPEYKRYKAEYTKAGWKTRRKKGSQFPRSPLPLHQLAKQGEGLRAVANKCID